MDNATSVDVYFYPKADRAQVTLNHGKLPNINKAEEKKADWPKQLIKLKLLLGE
ncbi:MAG TPA: hypothetical protein VMW28_03025 [Pelolinea sp.]|nr:hypothetical protein [Pelolinea sp.]